MKRRSFLITFTLSLFTSKALMASVSNNKVKISMNDVLDDDLFVIRYSQDGKFTVEDCFQMHNPKGRFMYEGTSNISEHIPGYINYNSQKNLSSNELLLICTANEREEFYSDKELFARTHYKSGKLFVDNTVFFPSLNPDKNDIPDYPLWFEKDNPSYEYNYYQLWENAVVCTGLVFGNSNEKELTFLNKEGELLTKVTLKPQQTTQKISLKNIKNKKITNEHVFAEVDNSLFSDDTEVDNKFIKKNAIFRIYILDKITKVEVMVTLPYPSPYVNSFYYKSI